MCECELESKRDRKVIIKLGLDIYMNFKIIEC